MLLTRNFALEEFTRSDAARRLGIANNPTPQIVWNLRMTALGLEQVRRAAVRGRAVRVLSGYRCPAVNAAVGGSPTSSHLTGFAADIAVDGMSAMGLAQAIRDSGIAFDQLILETSRGVVHIGFGPEMRQQVLTQRGAAGSAFQLGLVA